MTQEERRIFLLKTLLSEKTKYQQIEIPSDEQEQWRLLRSLFNIRMPKPASDEFIKVQDAYLKEEISRKGITDFTELEPIRDGLYLWRGDITTLKCDAVVNAANSQMLGCFCPNHGCIDNAVHTFSGIQLRLECSEIMNKQGKCEPTGKAKITKAYNLPCKYILHTVGPIVRGTVGKTDKKLLSSCYRSCLELAEKNNIKNIAFCCISTGEFHFPNKEAAKLAVKTVSEYKEQTQSEIEVIFNAFKEIDYDIYRKLLEAD